MRRWTCSPPIPLNAAVLSTSGPRKGSFTRGPTRRRAVRHRTASHPAPRTAALMPDPAQRGTVTCSYVRLRAVSCRAGSGVKEP